VPTRALTEEPADLTVPPADWTAPSFDELYDQYVAFVWRNLRRLGVAEASLCDVTQDVFLVVHRQLPRFEGRAPLISWLYSIVRRVARQHRRWLGRKDLSSQSEPDEVADARAPSPLCHAEQQESLRVLVELLATLDDDQREAVVLADLEEMTVPEIAAALGINLNTAYSRVRAARQKLLAGLELRVAKERAQ
jgi:RNA polymerase sigma-70 factor (ECF subfamily)